eukprot:2224786-Pleurochrysis_carterae.AAC.2
MVNGFVREMVGIGTGSPDFKSGVYGVGQGVMIFRYCIPHRSFLWTTSSFGTYEAIYIYRKI